ncbi:MAG: sulfoxide reductase heme-binding subunit YedZ [Terracidiphilus sp.]|nr:sulfoxide reductase heme-binding subunit YedZ [Terracidiphilus sp.]
MNRKTLIVMKVLVWSVCLAPALWIAWGATTNTLGADPTAAITFATGLATLRLLTVSLAITPLRQLFPRLSWLIKFRRLLGLFAFFYATLHLLTWVALYCGFDVGTMTSDVVKRRFITVGVAAWLLLLPLAATSTNWAIRKMGGKNWNRLHKLVYVAAGCGIVHYWWQVKTGVLTPLPMTVVITLLLVARPVLALVKRLKARAA